jgi:DNA repair protein RadD
MTARLRIEGIKADCIHGLTPTPVRKRLIHQFKTNHKNGPRVICNVEVLTTGFDAPNITHIIVARPTISRVLYEQIVGRGLRGTKFGGTDSCTIIDCIDKEKSGRIKFGYEYFREEWGIENVELFTK